MFSRLCFTAIAVACYSLVHRRQDETSQLRHILHTLSGYCLLTAVECPHWSQLIMVTLQFKVFHLQHGVYRDSEAPAYDTWHFSHASALETLCIFSFSSAHDKFWKATLLFNLLKEELSVFFLTSLNTGPQFLHEFYSFTQKNEANYTFLIKGNKTLVGQSCPLSTYSLKLLTRNQTSCFHMDDFPSYSPL